MSEVHDIVPKTFQRPGRERARKARAILEASVFGAAIALTVYSAILAKRGGVILPLAAIEPARLADQRAAHDEAAVDAVAPTIEMPEPVIVEQPVLPSEDHIRYFDGRPVRPVKVMWMKVTAYSPDERSCGEWADGRTATNHSVWVNAMRLVAADTRVLPFRSLVSVPGYAGGDIVPVLDRGGAIKGSRLDVLYPTHREALKWGVQDLPVVIWEYLDDPSGDVAGTEGASGQDAGSIDSIASS